MDLTARRDGLGAELDPDVFRNYERLATRHPGSCVATVSDNICSGCQMGILPRRLQEIKRADSVGACDSCHRFLAWVGKVASDDD